MKKLLNEIKNAYNNDYIKILSVFLLFFMSFGFIYFHADSFTSLDDQFFHIRFAEILKSEGLNAFTYFKWLYFSKIAQDQAYFIYYNFAFYLFLIPFTYLKPLFFGIKLYGVMFSAVSFTVLYTFLLKIKEKSPLFWVLVMFAVINYASIWRFLMTRPFTVAPALLLLELYFLYKKKYISLFFISIFYFYWHTATFFFVFGVAILYGVFESFYGKKINWKNTLAVVLGIIISLSATSFFAPGFFVYMKDIIFGVFYDTIIGKKVNISEGGELYPVDFFNFIKNNTIIVGIFIVSVVVEIFRYIENKKGVSDFFVSSENEKNPIRATLFLLSLVFLLGSFISKRNADFFVFFSAAYIIISFNYFVNFISIKSLPLIKALKLGIVLAIAYLFIGNIFLINSQIVDSGPYDSIEGAANWLKNNTPKGTVIFNTSWNFFPTLFYYNPDNYYITGIEPRFLYDYEPLLYWEWWNISTNGYVCNQEFCDDINKVMDVYLRSDEKEKEWYTIQGENIANSLKKNFNSNYLITASNFNKLNKVLDNSDRFSKVFSDNIYNTYFIYKVE